MLLSWGFLCVGIVIGYFLKGWASKPINLGPGPERPSGLIYEYTLDKPPHNLALPWHPPWYGNETEKAA